jgi:hypothetical protein
VRSSDFGIIERVYKAEEVTLWSKATMLQHVEHNYRPSSPPRSVDNPSEYDVLLIDVKEQRIRERKLIRSLECVQLSANSPRIVTMLCLSCSPSPSTMMSTTDEAERDGAYQYFVFCAH